MTRALALAPPFPRLRPEWLPFLAAVFFTLVLALAIGSASPLVVYPVEWVVPVDAALTRAIKWLLNEADLGVFTVKQMTRALGAALQEPMEFLRGVFATGFALTDEAGSPTGRVPPLSWISVAGIFLVLGVALRDWRLVLLIGLSFLYVALFGLWEATMVTFASIIVAVVYGIAFGVLLGILAYRSRLAEQVLTPLFDLMQTTPVFAYLVPSLMLFGYGPAAAIFITMVYAMPPMARVTTLALRQVSADVVEFGRMAGCSRRQLLWKVMLPSARPSLMVGVNQVIMLTLNMVIIASMIGAGGLGFNVWQALKSLRIGEGAEAGIAITLVAIVLDRISQRYAARRPEHRPAYQSLLARHRFLIGGLALALLPTLLGLWVDPLARFPEDATVTTGRFWDNIVDWININLFEYIGAVRDFFFVHVLKPFKAFMLSLPWLGVLALIAGAGFALGGWRLSLFVAALTGFIAIVGLWEKAMLSVYLVGVCVFLAMLIGVPVGVWASGSDRVHRIVGVVIDTLQTLPSFVYLIPVVMLFSVGDFSAMIAVVFYAVVPAIRYTDHGIRQVPAAVVEAARAVGCTRFQIFRKVQFPLALPEIMLGVNQTIMMGLSMLVITALVGTRDLGQETLIALSKVDPGHGVVAGVSVACIAMIADRLINAWAKRRKRELGFVV
ncbi:MAG TPA: ABC transporter permease subunit [Alphaproteobacteria bacterium]|nr:ABC transporter permease subunit [Alphaproteobacteria bacterium]